MEGLKLATTDPKLRELVVSWPIVGGGYSSSQPATTYLRDRVQGEVHTYKEAQAAAATSPTGSTCQWSPRTSPFVGRTRLLGLEVEMSAWTTALTDTLG